MKAITRRVSNRAVAATTAALVVAIGFGCGGDGNDDTGEAVARLLEPPRTCLVAAGGSLALSSDDVSFYLTDFERDRTDKPAGAGYRGVEVSQHLPIAEGAPEGRDPLPRYSVWIGSRVSEAEPIPATLVNDDREDTFVVFMRTPSRDQLAKAMRCLDKFGTGAL